MPTLYLLVALFVLLGGAAFVGQAEEGQGISFSWRGSQESSVIGYRLYYGDRRRLDAASPGEEYDYFLDFSSWQRCSTDSNRPACEMLRPGEVNCSNLEAIRPKCIIKGLAGGSTFFAVTAYSLNSESGYSREVNLLLDSNGNFVRLIQADHLPSVYRLLLSKESETTVH